MRGRGQGALVWAWAWTLLAPGFVMAQDRSLPPVLEEPDIEVEAKGLTLAVSELPNSVAMASANAGLASTPMLPPPAPRMYWPSRVHMPRCSALDRLPRYSSRGAPPETGAVAARHPHLHATVLDQAPVQRIAVAAANFFVEPLPPGHDVHLLSNVLHDWDEPEVRHLLAASFASLPAGGLLVIHDAFLNADKTGSVPVADRGFMTARRESRGRRGLVTNLRVSASSHRRPIPDSRLPDSRLPTPDCRQ